MKWDIYVQCHRHICSWVYVSNVKYMSRCFCSHCRLHWVHMRHKYWHSCIICAHEPIGTCDLYVVFEGHISFWHMHGNSMYSVIWYWWCISDSIAFHLLRWLFRGITWLLCQCWHQWHVPITEVLVACHVDVSHMIWPTRNIEPHFSHLDLRINGAIDDTVSTTWCQCYANGIPWPKGPDALQFKHIDPRNIEVLLMMYWHNVALTVAPIISHDHKSHFIIYFDWLDIRNVLVLLTMLLALCDANAGINNWK